jgi:cytidylate kinase
LVCLVAPLEARARNIMQTLRLTRENALRHIARTEREQRLWVRKNCNADIDDASHYHLVINTASVTAETIVQLVKDIARARC